MIHQRELMVLGYLSVLEDSVRKTLIGNTGDGLRRGWGVARRTRGYVGAV